jgi:phenylacetate-coenzyme A ligase PaaK-like adenylate-forming protein
VTEDADTRARHVARFDELAAELSARIDWPAQRLREERSNALRVLVATAVERSPWHRRRLSGIDVDSLTDADIAWLPSMTKSDLMDNFDEIVTDRRVTLDLCEAVVDGRRGGEYLLGEYRVVASGGASGRRGVFVYGWDAWATCYASIVRFQQRDWNSDPALAGVARVTAVLGAAGGAHMSAAVGRTFTTDDNPRHAVPVDQPIEAIVARLNELNPTILMGYSSFLPTVAREADAGRLRIRPRRVVAISEPLLPEARTMIERTWGAPVANGYGMSEGVFTGACGQSMHLPDDLCIVESIDSNGQLVGPDEPGCGVLITNLYNPLLPLIRYEVSDELTVLNEACRCGSAMTRIADPLGRADDAFAFDGNTVVHAHVFRSVLARPDITEYQVRQTDRGAHVRIVTTEVDQSALQHELEDKLARLGLAEPSVIVEVVAAIERLPTGKLQRFVPRRPATT